MVLAVRITAFDISLAICSSNGALQPPTRASNHANHTFSFCAMRGEQILIDDNTDGLNLKQSLRTCNKHIQQTNFHFEKPSIGMAKVVMWPDQAEDVSEKWRIRTHKKTIGISKDRSNQYS